MQIGRTKRGLRCSGDSLVLFFEHSLMGRNVDETMRQARVGLKSLLSIVYGWFEKSIVSKKCFADLPSFAREARGHARRGKRLRQV